MEKEFRTSLQKRKASRKDIDFAVTAVKEFEVHLDKIGTSFESAQMELLKDYIALLIEEGRNSWERLAAIARYSNVAKKNDYYVYFTSVLGARNVLPDLSERVASIAGDPARRKVFQGFAMPPLGAPQENYPRLTQRIMSRLEAELPLATCKKILTWNYHRVPTEAFAQKKARFEAASSIDDYLKREHEKLVEELEECLASGRIWYEQEITREVLEFVKANQEICTGIRCDGKIYVTKIPYAPKQYLAEQNPTLKRYYACHCPLARSAILEEMEISSTFCYCSGGFEKLHFDVIFDQPVSVELLESALKGDQRCRFANTIPEGQIK
jgi:hypothetical protein